jgi:colanic acid/amylovoran biosynthesis glycosyltransferase
VRIAYLVNQYPSVSHTFIRREIEGLEQLGAQVARYSLRPIPLETLPDATDRSERERTTALLDHGAKALIPSIARVAARYPREFARAQALTYTMGKKADRGLLRNYAYLAEACALREALEAAPVDHVHAHFGTNSAAVAMLTRALGGPSYSFTAHGPEEFDKPDLLALRVKIEHAAFVVGVSSFGRSQLFRYCDGRHWNKVHVVRCGVDERYLERAPNPLPERPRFVSVGRLCEQKGQLLLVQAVAQLVRKGRKLELILVGDGPMRKDVEEVIAKEGLERFVRITGWASGEAVQDEIEKARYFVLPSFAEGLPVVLMEALGRGRPVISTYVAGIPELVLDNECGFLVPAGSVEHVASAMERALDTSSEQLQKMGLLGYQRVCEMHDARSNAKVLLELFERHKGQPH